MARMLWKPSLFSIQASLSRPFRFRSLQVKMNHDFLAGIENGAAQNQWRKLRIAPCVVRNRNPVDLRARDKVIGEVTCLDRAHTGHRAAHRHQFRSDKKARRVSEFFAQRLHMPRRALKTRVS